MASVVLVQPVRADDYSYEQQLKSELAAQLNQNKSNPSAASTYYQLAELYRKRKILGEASSYFRRALAYSIAGTSSAVYGSATSWDVPDDSAIDSKLKNPGTISGSALNANILLGLASIYSEQGLFQDAEQLLKRVADMSNDQNPFGGITIDPLSSSRALAALAELYARQGRFNDAESYYKKSIAYKEQTYGPDSAQVLPELKGLAALYKSEHKQADVEDIEKRISAITEKLR
jgi:tetratricopeptide (TPR) repeat protein